MNNPALYLKSLSYKVEIEYPNLGLYVGLFNSEYLIFLKSEHNSYINFSYHMNYDNIPLFPTIKEYLFIKHNTSIISNMVVIYLKTDNNKLDTHHYPDRAYSNYYGGFSILLNRIYE